MLRKIADRISSTSRLRKLKQLDALLRPAPHDSILEVGVADIEYSEVDNYLIKKYPYKEQLTALGIDSLHNFMQRYPAVKAVTYDGVFFPFLDRQFDIAHSNAVIEHVGSWDNQKTFLSEMIRVSKRGMLTTPNKFFPIEIHTRLPLIHLLPKSIFDAILIIIGKKWATGNYMNLLTYSDIKELMNKFDGVSFRIIRNRLLFFTMTFTIVFETRDNGSFTTGEK